ncbi:unnamed protein product [Tenebrio molitor]|nr:unnamed protein product [Tenebrio molitor]
MKCAAVCFVLVVSGLVGNSRISEICLCNRNVIATSNNRSRTLSYSLVDRNNLFEECEHLAVALKSFKFDISASQTLHFYPPRLSDIVTLLDMTSRPHRTSRHKTPNLSWIKELEHPRDSLFTE